MPVRPATHEDIDAIVDMGQRFLEFAPHGAMIDATREEIRAGVAQFLEVGTIFLAERNGVPCAMLACVLVPVWFAPNVLMAHELAWWVEEDARGSTAAVRLVHAFEEHARRFNAQVLTMSQLHAGNGEQVGRMLQKLGYAPSETTFVKGT